MWPWETGAGANASGQSQAAATRQGAGAGRAVFQHLSPAERSRTSAVEALLGAPEGKGLRSLQARQPRHTAGEMLPAVRPPPGEVDGRPACGDQRKVSFHLITGSTPAAGVPHRTDPQGKSPARLHTASTRVTWAVDPSYLTDHRLLPGDGGCPSRAPLHLPCPSKRRCGRGLCGMLGRATGVAESQRLAEEAPRPGRGSTGRLPLPSQPIHSALGRQFNILY